jgi:hypothetical protein
MPLRWWASRASASTLLLKALARDGMILVNRVVVRSRSQQR